MIKALPDAAKVTTKDKAAIEAARKAYNALSQDQKKKVSAEAVKKLEAAEKALAAIKTLNKEAQSAMNCEVVVTQKGKKITVQWHKANTADGYDVYVQYCGKKFNKPAMTIKNKNTTKISIKKINGKKLKLKKQFKVYVAAYKYKSGKKVILARSNEGHIVGVKNKKYSNVKSLTLTQTAYTVNVGKTVKINARDTLVNKHKKHIPSKHIAKFRYRTSDASVATVSKTGVVKGISKGNCVVYVYAVNGKMKTARITVK